MLTRNSGIREFREYGFELLTNWESRSGKLKPASTDWDQAGWIYAFVVDEGVRYIGITTMVLRSRLDGYSYQLNDRVGALIGEQFELERDVLIYGLQRRGVSKSELEREESDLIERFNPDWNVEL